MNVKFIFQRISQKLLEDFYISSQIAHNGVKGDFRESYLREFLEDGKLPPKYAIGSGLIVSPFAQQSNQSDLIIYDRDKCPAWMFSQRVQVFPIEGIYGIIEVKSVITKDKLYEGLKHIENLRRMIRVNNAILPFGIIFGYKLQGNSLESLQQNLRDYQKQRPAWTWPNLIVVLEEGIIFQLGRGLKYVLKAENFSQLICPTAFWFKNDTLFEFYSALFSILSSTQLRQVNIGDYREIPSKIGEHLVRNSIFCQKGDTVYQFSESFIKKIISYCHTVGKKTFRDIITSWTGDIPDNFFTAEELLAEYYYYDPENLPGLHQVKEPYKINEQGRPVLNSRMKVPSTYIDIDGETYYIPEVYVMENEGENLTEIKRESS